MPSGQSICPVQIQPSLSSTTDTDGFKFAVIQLPQKHGYNSIVCIFDLDALRRTNLKHNSLTQTFANLVLKIKSLNNSNNSAKFL